MDEIREYKARKNGEATPLRIAEEIVKEGEKGDYDVIIALTLQKDGQVFISYTKGNLVEMLGVLEIGRDIIKDEIYGEG